MVEFFFLPDGKEERRAVLKYFVRGNLYSNVSIQSSTSFVNKIRARFTIYYIF